MKLYNSIAMILILSFYCIYGFAETTKPVVVNKPNVIRSDVTLSQQLRTYAGDSKMVDSVFLQLSQKMSNIKSKTIDSEFILQESKAQLTPEQYLNLQIYLSYIKKPKLVKNGIPIDKVLPGATNSKLSAANQKIVAIDISKLKLSDKEADNYIKIFLILFQHLPLWCPLK